MYYYYKLYTSDTSLLLGWLLNYVVLKCADITGYEHEEFIMKLPGILEHKQILTWRIVFFNNCRTK